MQLSFIPVMKTFQSRSWRKLENWSIINKSNHFSSNLFSFLDMDSKLYKMLMVTWSMLMLQAKYTWRTRKIIIKMLKWFIISAKLQLRCCHGKVWIRIEKNRGSIEKSAIHNTVWGDIKKFKEKILYFVDCRFFFSNPIQWEWSS